MLRSNTVNAVLVDHTAITPSSGMSCCCSSSWQPVMFVKSLQRLRARL